MPRVIVHGQFIEDFAGAGDRRWTNCGKVTRDDNDLWVVTGSSGTDVLVVKSRRGVTASGALAELPSTVVAESDLLVLVEDNGGPPGSTISCHFVDRLDEPVDVSVIPRNVDLFDRVRGVFETDVLRERTVAVVGLGSGGSFIARELAKSGVGRFVLIDGDRVEVGNVCRHECGLSDVGRLKVNAMRDYILDRNPGAAVEVHSTRVTGADMGTLRSIVRTADLVICGTDNRESRLLVNRAIVLEEKTAIYGAVFRRAHGGQVLRVVPGLSPCYQCFVSLLPQMASDREISSAGDAAAIAYSDRPVAIEPGLSSDILPIALMMVKLALVELLRDCTTTLDSLRKDFVAPLYLWVNRRDITGQYGDWSPMEINVDQRTILRWYGIDIPRRPECAACGELSLTFA